MNQARLFRNQIIAKTHEEEIRLAFTNLVYLAKPFLVQHEIKALR